LAAQEEQQAQQASENTKPPLSNGSLILLEQLGGH